MGRVGFEIEQHVQKMEYKTMHVGPVEGKPLADDGMHLWALSRGSSVMVAPHTNEKGKHGIRHSIHQRGALRGVMLASHETLHLLVV